MAPLVGLDHSWLCLDLRDTIQNQHFVVGSIYASFGAFEIGFVLPIIIASCAYLIGGVFQVGQRTVMDTAQILFNESSRSNGKEAAARLSRLWKKCTVA